MSSPAATHENSLLESAQRIEGLHTLAEIREWLRSRREQNRFRVTKLPLGALEEWNFDQGGNLVHRTGRFFQVNGIEARIEGAAVPHWQQPILVQPEVGILGFLACQFEGVLHFLVQAKMEPGNVNLVQLSPTVQATQSNYSQVHGGARPRYVDYFLPGNRARVICDQLQSEQGTRFLRKQNRNVVVEIAAAQVPANHDDFCWMTLGQLGILLREDNTVNMDSRSVLGCLPLHLAPRAGQGGSGLAGEIQDSMTAGEEDARHGDAELTDWLQSIRSSTAVDVRPIALNAVHDWARRDGVIAHCSGRYFAVIGVGVEASSREVAAWKQPLIESAAGGVLAFAFARFNGLLHLLVQARSEPGLLTGTELAPTVQFTPANYRHLPSSAWPAFHELLHADKGKLPLDVKQSEEGGRFYGDVRRNLLLEVDPHITVPPRYAWMTIRQLKTFIASGTAVNIEARTLLACVQGLLAGSA